MGTMAVHTPLSKAEISTFLCAAGLEPAGLEGAEGVAEGSIHTTYRLRHVGRTRYLRRYEGSTIEAIEHELALLAHLRSRIAPASFTLPEVVVHADGRLHRPVLGAPAVLFEEVPGAPRAVETLEGADLKQIGRTLAALHGAAEGFEIRRVNPFGPETVEAWLRALEREPGSEEVARALPSLWQAFEKGKAAGVDPGSETRVVAHGDLFPDNLHWREGTIAGVLDLEMAADLPRAWDLAVGLLVFCWARRGLDPGRARALVGGYQEIDARLAEPEALLGALNFVAVRYATSRIRDFARSSLPVERLAQKDWRIFARRIDDLAGLMPDDLEFVRDPDPG